MPNSQHLLQGTVAVYIYESFVNISGLDVKALKLIQERKGGGGGALIGFWSDP